MSQSAAPASHSPAAHEKVEGRAAALVNPASGLANDYLNLFNEIVMLIEQLPNMPELMSDLLAWKPVNYVDYFRQSPLPGRESALDAYGYLDAKFRRDFEAIVAELDRIATGAVASIRRHHRVKGESDAAGLASGCDRFGASLRAVLQRATNLVNYGSCEAEESAQRRADRLLAVRLQVLKDVGVSPPPAR
ncbi:MAG TPA: hypothetical protein VND97_01630 [Beijerinckiaceae bacterium]|nr:hypothetical protein [Beijerinckiaceae bacterium]